MTTPAAPAPELVVYPDSDGQPMSDNTLQFRWIVTLQGNLDAMFRDDPNVFVASDLLWYPVEGRPEIRTGPDVLAAFGRPKGYRGSYRQWEEGGVAPQVVFEVLSPGNRPAELIRKFRFYDRYGVQEYYVYDPDHVRLDGWVRKGQELQEIPDTANWVSPRLGIRFDLSGPELVVYRPDGQPFLTFLELEQQRARFQKEAEQARQQAERAEQEREEARRRADRLAAQLRALGTEPEA